MTKAEFFEQLNEGLKKVRKDERADILAEYEEHFHHALAKGKTEDQICKDLGSVDQIIKDYRIEKVLADQVTGETGHAKSIMRAALILMALAPLNFLVFIGPFLVTMCLLVAFWSVGGSLFLVGAAMFFTLLVKIFSSLLVPVLMIGCVGIASLGIFFMLLLLPITQLAGAMTFRYLKWNLDFARGH
ncbi:DUF1700 domain-containing protein [Bdellovibrio sp. KM01]|uniref:DUF1700 domain-containing protein n=1 Tax=Bdellovibrio sp. KM01 TaxID=2748865 RepID=UPI0015E8F696|nr:DUF1700 domain-containing protein [Bdellovibrio sp. KM01]QLY26519.1 DUF1700 domain-containing protein [Bdellovibrio sp. KM01]